MLAYKSPFPLKVAPAFPRLSTPRHELRSLRQTLILSPSTPTSAAPHLLLQTSAPAHHHHCHHRLYQHQLRGVRSVVVLSLSAHLLLPPYFPPTTTSMYTRPPLPQAPFDHASAATLRCIMAVCFHFSFSSAFQNNCTIPMLPAWFAGLICVTLALLQGWLSPVRPGEHYLATYASSFLILAIHLPCLI